MGPGSFDPGNIAGQTIHEIDVELQWGRGLLTPEIIGERRGLKAKAMLQWGRGLLTPEIRTPPPGKAVLRNASMGPGSFDPGNRSGIADPDAWAQASMGPGSFDPGNDRLPGIHPTRRRRFNGAGVF